MTFEVGVVGTFSAHHHLVGDFGPASAPHGHAYRVEAQVSGQTVRPDGTLVDISLLQQALGVVLAALNDRDLNGIDTLAASNPTAEMVAHYIFDAVAPALRQRGLSKLCIRVWESPEAFAAYADALT